MERHYDLKRQTLADFRMRRWVEAERKKMQDGWLIASAILIAAALVALAVVMMW